MSTLPAEKPTGNPLDDQRSVSLLKRNLAADEGTTPERDIRLSAVGEPLDSKSSALNTRTRASVGSTVL